MQTLNQTLEKNILDADGRYLDSQELQPLEQYVRSYAARLDAYQQLRDHGEKLVLIALRKLATMYPELVQQHGGRCKYDMVEVLRYIAISILRDDEVFFKDQMMVWLDTILLAHKRQSQCGQAYRNLQEAIVAHLSASANSLIRPYLEITIQVLEGHV